MDEFLDLNGVANICEHRILDLQGLNRSNGRILSTVYRYHQ